MTTLPHTTTEGRYRTAKEWLHDLGDVPLDRILFDPTPGTATEADLRHKVDVEKQLCELVYGTLVEKPMGYHESLVAAALIYFLRAFVLPRKSGFVSGEASTLKLAAGLVRLPDVAFVSRDRLPGGIVPPEPVPMLAPDLAVEVLSEGNTPAEMRRKVDEYFDAGTRLVWIIDPKKRNAVVYTSTVARTTVLPDGKLNGGDVLPGFEVALADLFVDLPPV